MSGEELGLEGQHEQSLQFQVAGDREQPVDDGVADAVTLDRRCHRHGPHLAEIGPQHMQRPAAHHLVVDLGHPELLHRLVEGDEVLLQQDLPGVGVDQALDLGYIRGSGAADGHVAVPALRRDVGHR